ncbi:hypothetical protein HNR55_001130 [Acetobacter lovaniensis]|uniref:Uncharacterized protein n=1 Tax=Acetobacter lovaniensis TaxID=104100 RepID=A0A841QDP1_9PROT|nr:hypothetical protein [Acetobacter lovaniensis]
MQTCQTRSPRGRRSPWSHDLRASPQYERTLRHEVWRRYDGNDWQAFDALPPAYASA